VTADQFNQECVAKLEAAQFRNRIAVIGSGPSISFVTSLPSFVKKMEERCGLKWDEKEHFSSFFERAYIANEDVYYGAIEESFGNPPHCDVRTYRHLVKIGFRSYVTFNYDNQLPSAFRECYSSPEDFSVYPPANGQSTAVAADLGHKKRLVAIHGYCDAKNPNWVRQIILKTSDYDRHYVNADTNRFLFNWWKDVLAAHPCVFIGTSLEEPGLAGVVKYLLKDENQNFQNHGHIHLKDTQRSPEPPYYPPNGTTFSAFRQILFDPIDDRFTGLLKVLEYFSGISIENPSPGMAAPSAITATNKSDF
jgi:hypothetical protein